MWWLWARRYSGDRGSRLPGDGRCTSVCGARSSAWSGWWLSPSLPCRPYCRPVAAWGGWLSRRTGPAPAGPGTSPAPPGHVGGDHRTRPLFRLSAPRPSPGVPRCLWLDHSFPLHQPIFSWFSSLALFSLAWKTLPWVFSCLECVVSSPAACLLAESLLWGWRLPPSPSPQPPLECFVDGIIVYVD